jgi:hypothetical protein
LSVLRPQDQEQKGLNDLEVIFRWLRDNHVTRIYRIIIVDNEEPSHTDTAIVRALEDFDVKIWDWKKLDLCTDVILKAAPDVEEVTLYSSGNTAVLLGWSSPDGLPKLDKVRLVPFHKYGILLV